MNVLDNSVDVDVNSESIVKFLWRVRRIVMLTIIGLLLLLWAHLVFNEYRTTLAEYRTAFADLQNYNYVENSSFSSANLDRVDEGVYELRVEVSGGRADIRRQDTPVDFDRDLRITVQMLNGILLLNITNMRNDIIIQDVEIRGSLASRGVYDFHQIFVEDIQANLGYNETSRGIPISIFTTNNFSQLQLENWQWISDIEEFRENFKLHYIEVTFRADDEDEFTRLRYTTSTDFYEIRGYDNFGE